MRTSIGITRCTSLVDGPSPQRGRADDTYYGWSFNLVVSNYRETSSLTVFDASARANFSSRCTNHKSNDVL